MDMVQIVSMVRPYGSIDKQTTGYNDDDGYVYVPIEYQTAEKPKEPGEDS